MATEKQLIGKQTAIKLLRGKCIAKYPTSFYLGLIAAADEIEKLPEVDAVEVVHGHWNAMFEYEDFQYAHCSACSKRSEYMTRYCPNCGAKMDGDGNGC